jgi:hypothetical protein
MQRAWGLHQTAQFKDIGENRFVIRFSSEGDWKHVLGNGPWQFDFSVILIKNYDGAVLPSDMIFNSLEIWDRVLDLPMDMMNRAYGELIGGWIGKFVTVEVDEEGMAWGEDLRIRVEIRVDQPLLRGVPLKNSDEEEEGKWFDLKYERVPHFCFDCGCLVHPSSGCGAENAGDAAGVQQWGEWLRASPRKSQRPPASARPSVSSGSYSGRSTGAGSKQAAMPSVRDLPPRRNLLKDYSGSSLSHTGGYERQRGSQEVTSSGKLPDWRERDSWCEQEGEGLGFRSRGRGTGTYTRRKRGDGSVLPSSKAVVPMGTMSKKRGTKQIWQRVEVQVVGEESSQTPGKRQRTASVFDRLEDPIDSSADPTARGRRDQ